MKKNELPCWAALAIIAALLLLAVFIWQFPKNSSEWAAWMQAFGSVGAICVAIAIPIINEIREENKKREKLKGIELNLYLELHEIIDGLMVSLEYFSKIHFGDGDSIDESFCMDPYRGDFQRIIVSMKPYVNRLGEAPSLAPILRRFIFGLISFDRYLNMIPALQDTGYPAFWRNNIDHTERLVLKLREVGGEVVVEINKILDENNIRSIEEMIYD